jgi:hypothetical protein
LWILGRLRSSEFTAAVFFWLERFESWWSSQTEKSFQANEVVYLQLLYDAFRMISNPGFFFHRKVGLSPLLSYLGI